MANNVRTFLFINTTEDSFDKKVLDEVKRIFKYDINNPHQVIETEQLAMSLYGDRYPQEYDRSWSETFLGGKWIDGYIVEMTDSEIYIDLTTAWGTASPFVDELIKQLTKIDKNVFGIGTYEDEFYNFAGVMFFSKDHQKMEALDLSFMDEYDDDELIPRHFMFSRMTDDLENLYNKILNSYLQEKKSVRIVDFY